MYKCLNFQLRRNTLYKCVASTLTAVARGPEFEHTSGHPKPNNKNIQAPARAGDHAPAVNAHVQEEHADAAGAGR